MRRVPVLCVVTIVVLVFSGFASSYAQVIDFETLPGGAPTTDQQLISDEYLSLGVTFTLLDHMTGVPIGAPRIAKEGSPATAFEGCAADDTPYPYLGLGESFLTDGNAVAIEGDLCIEYTTPVAQASGLILDIDCRTNGGPPCEQWTITAYDTNGTAIDSVVLNAPVGPPNPGCQSPGAGPGDSEAFGWSFEIGAANIKTIILRYTGTAPNTGLAFDNFSLSSVPVQLGVVTTSAADSICRGESVELSAFPSGGLPPYSFQWQQKYDTSSWFDIGTAPTKTVTPVATTDFRVIVSDAADNVVTGAEITIIVDADNLLCMSSLLVSSNQNSRIVRYSFLSSQGEIFVPSGSGGLSGTSKIVCGPDANVYAVSQNNARVLRYDGGTGDFIDIFVSAGSGGLNVPVGLDFGPDGHLYVVSNTNHSVLRYDGTTGAFIDAFVPNGSGLNNPTGLLWGPDDHLYVCSRDSDKVLHFDQSGTPLGDFVTSGSGGLDAPRGLAFGPDGNLYVCEEINDSVRRFDGSTGAFIDVFIAAGSGGLDRANDVAFGPDDVLYVASFNNDMVLGYDATSGLFLGALPNSLLNGPAWCAVGCQSWATGIHDTPPPRLTLSVEPNVPNPFNPWTRVGFELPTAGRVRATVVDVAGRVVATLFERQLSEGRHTVEWNGEVAGGAPASSGIYFIHIQSGGMSAARKITLVR